MQLPSVWLFFVFIGILVVLEVIALYMIYSYFRLIKSYDTIMKKQRDLEQNIHQRSEQLLKVAQNQAQTVIDQANTKAQAIVTQAQFFNQSTQDKVNDALQYFVQQTLASYQQLFERIQQQTVGELQKTARTLGDNAGEQAAVATKAFGLAMAEAQKRAETQLLTAYQKSEEEVANYKAIRLKHLNQQTTVFVQEAARRFFKKALTREQHEALVMEALDEAQREKFF
jgi:hypothetical protein